MRLSPIAEVVRKPGSLEGSDRGRLLSDIVRNSGALIFSRGLLGVTKVLALLYLAHHLGSGDFGRFSLVLALIEVFRTLSDFGVETVAIRSLARGRPEAEPEILSSSIAVKAVLACLAYMVIVLVSSQAYWEQGITSLSAVAGLSLFAWTLSSALNSIFQANLRMAEVVPAHIAGGAAYVAGLTVGAFFRWPLHLLVSVIPFSELVILGFSAALYYRKGRPRVRFCIATAGTILSLAWPVGLTSFIVMAYTRLDTLLLGRLIGEAAVGQYAVAYRITEPFLIFPAAFSVSLYSAASALWGSRGEAVKRLYFSCLIGSVFYASLTVLGLILFAPSILALISPQYLGSASALRVLSCSLVFMSCNMMSTAIINAMGRYRFLTIGGAATLLVNIGLNLYLIPYFGILGASIATVGTEAFNFMIQTGYIYTRTYPVAMRDFRG